MLEAKLFLSQRSEQFTKQLEPIFHTFIEEIFNLFGLNVLQPFLAKGAREATEEIMEVLGKDLHGNILSNAQDDAYKYAFELVTSLNKNVLTTNEKILIAESENYKKVVQLMQKKLKKDLQDLLAPHFFFTICDVFGFIVAKMKMLLDLVQLKTTFAVTSLLASLKKGLENKMMEPKTLQAIIVSRKVVKRRKYYLDQKKIIKDGLHETISL